MAIKVLFAARADRWDAYRASLRTAFARAGLTVDLATTHTPEIVDYIVYAPNGPLQDFSPFTACKAVLSLWAGVEDIVRNPTLRVPLVRMVDPRLTEGMVEYVTAHVLRHHLGLDAYIRVPPGDWTPATPPLARNRGVTVLGLGALGATCAQALAALNFDVAGWSRSPKNLPGVTTHHGQDGLRQALAHGQITVLLLPLTDATEDMLDAKMLRYLPKAAVLINPGRGALIDDSALIAALDTGHVAHATLDTFRVEPLPEDHPFWRHPAITVTPHIASITRPESCATMIANNIRRGEAGQPLLHLVDRDNGY